MMCLIALAPRRVGFNISQSLQNTCRRNHVAFVTTAARDPPADPPTDSSADPDQDLDVYMKQARERIASVKPKWSFDTLSPTSSHLLLLALNGQIPGPCSTSPLAVLRHHGDQRNRPRQLPAGHHLVYFPLQVGPDGLMPDGTDKDHYPGWPFVRRMWAGGSVTFADDHAYRMLLNSRPGYCVETLGEPVLKRGAVPADDKIFINVRRRYGVLHKNLHSHLSDEFFDSPGKFLPSGEELLQSSDEYFGQGLYSSRLSLLHHEPENNSDIVERMIDYLGGNALIDETRQLVFMRERTTPVPVQLAPAEETISRSPPRLLREPDFGFEVTPDRTLLFHFSALSYNAHAIHLDTHYARNVEGYKDLLVHGPLTLAAMLSGLEEQCRVVNWGNSSGGEDHVQCPGWVVESINYRNLRPLYCGEKMTVYFKVRTPESFGEGRKHWSVWIEGPDGRLAVKGEAVTVDTSAAHPEILAKLRSMRAARPNKRYIRDNS